MKSIQYITIVCYSLLLTASFAFAQQPAAGPPKELKIEAVTVETGAVPGTAQTWVKLVAKFQSTPRWADGIAFSFTALLGTANQYRVLNGVVRYANIKAGSNRAVMYISPNTVERFGVPLAVKVKAYKNEESDEAEYKTSATYPADWDRKFDKYPGLLLTVIQTPWLISDYASSPDIFATQ
ncbi:MAG: hypothetical protein ACXV9Q_06740 [Chthoniobacterales bacterium]